MEKPPTVKGVGSLPHLPKPSASRAAAYAALIPAQQADDDALRALVQDVARHRQPGAPSDHSDRPRHARAHRDRAATGPFRRSGRGMDIRRG